MAAWTMSSFGFGDVLWFGGGEGVGVVLLVSSRVFTMLLRVLLGFTQFFPMIS